MSSPVQYTTPKRLLTWLVTGCSSCIGLAIARRVQAEGHYVVATSRNPSRTHELVREIEQKGGKWIKLDLDDLGCGKIIGDWEREERPVDVLCNNAGYAILHPLESFTEQEVKAQMETVYFGPFRLIRAAVPDMKRRRFGIVINISSGAGLEGRENQATYASAKATMDGLVKVLAKEVAEFNIRTLTVHLGIFNTNMPCAIIKGSELMPDDYKGTVTDKSIEIMLMVLSRRGDKDKAAKQIFDVAMGYGAGAGHEGEYFLPPGVERMAKFKLVRDRLDRCTEMYGDVCNSVAIDQ